METISETTVGQNADNKWQNPYMQGLRDVPKEVVGVGRFQDQRTKSLV